MASITVRGLDPELKQKLREQAARHGRSMEAEVREVLAKSVAQSASHQPRSLLDVMGVIPGAGLTDEEAELLNSVRRLGSNAVRIPACGDELSGDDQ